MENKMYMDCWVIVNGALLLCLWALKKQFEQNDAYIPAIKNARIINVVN